MLRAYDTMKNGRKIQHIARLDQLSHCRNLQSGNSSTHSLQCSASNTANSFYTKGRGNSFRASTRENKHDLMMVENKGHESHQMPGEVSHNFMNTLDAFLQGQSRVYETNLSLFATYPVQKGKGVSLYVAPASFQACSSIPEKSA